MLHLVPMIFVMGAIFFLSHQPGDSLYMPSIPGIDKVAHMAAYAALAAAVLYAFQLLPAMNKTALQVSLLTIGFCIFYGIGDEFHQSFIPYRYVSFADLVADALGAVTASVAWFLWKGRRGAEAKNQYCTSKIVPPRG
mgnify:CR=1 FL=1